MSETTELIAQQILNGNINKRTWGDILYNVKTYGATGNGTTDDTAAIQATIDYALSVGGKAIFFPHGTYKVTALTGLSSVVLFGDNASFVGISTTINQIGSPTSNLANNVKEYGAKGDGLTNDAAAIQSAITAATTSGGIIFLPPGTYKISTALTVPSNVTLWFANGAKLSMDSGITVTINGPIDAGLYQIFSGSGAVSGFSKISEVYPEWWGAVGDAIANDAAAIQKAINAGSHISLDSGTYYIGSTSLALAEGKYLIGAGKHATTILYDGPTMNAITVSNIFTSWGISDLKMKQTGTPTAGAAINVDTASNGTVERVYFEDVYSGIITKNAQANRYLNLDIWRFKNFGIALLGGNNDLFIENCFINGQTVGGIAGPGTGIRMYDKNEAIMCVNVEIVLCAYNMFTDAAANTVGVRPAYCRFLNCFFDSATQGGANLNNSVNMEFTNCWLSGILGCTLLTVDDVTFANCSFINCGQHGCLVQATAKRAKFIGCKFIANSANGAGTYHGLIIASGTTDFIVQGCTATNGLGFTGTQGWGIIVASGASDRYIVADNLVSGNVTGGVSDGGTGTNKRVANNY